MIIAIEVIYTRVFRSFIDQVMHASIPNKENVMRSEHWQLLIWKKGV